MAAGGKKGGQKPRLKGGTPGGRTNKVEAARQAREAAEARKKRTVIAGVVLVALVVIVTVALSKKSDNEAAKELQAEVTAGDCTFDTKTDPGRDHVDAPTFKVDPPAGGDHLAQPATAGTYDKGEVPLDGNLVHSMEHGFIVLWYKPDLPAADLDQLLTIADEHSDSVLVVPRASLSTPVAATAWHKRLLCPTLEAETLVKFVEGYRDQGPEKGFM